METDDLLQRALLLQSRFQALQEVSAAYSGMHADFDTDASAEEIAVAYARASAAFLAWLNIAGAEIGDELKLIADEHGIPLPD